MRLLDEHMKEMQALYPLRDANLSKANALQHLSQPLLKNKVYAMTHKKESYAGKWRAMKEKREERMNRDYMRDHRKNAIASLTRLVSDGEKSSMYRFLQERNAVEQVMAKQMLRSGATKRICARRKFTSAKKSYNWRSPNQQQISSMQLSPEWRLPAPL